MTRPSVLVVLLAGMAAAGCDSKPQPVHLNLWHKMDVIGVAPGDQEEAAAATANETARVEYLHRLQILMDFYIRVGNKDRLDWARRERKNAEEAQWFTWAGIPVPAAPTGGAGNDERWLVERVVQARNAYTKALAQLRALYEQKGERTKAECIRRTQERLDEVRMYAYNFEADIPGPNLRPLRTVPEAETLFGQAYDAYMSGKRLPLLTSYTKERQALTMFQDVVRKYPDSLRIAMSAFYVGEIYKDFFNEDLRAVRWYERAWQWDPKINLPARFQAAVVCDQRLKDTRRAIELYREVLKVETFNQANVNSAHRRLAQLGALEAPVPPVPPAPVVPPPAPVRKPEIPPAPAPAPLPVPVRKFAPPSEPIILPEPSDSSTIPLGASGTTSSGELAPVQGVGPARRE